MSLHARTDSLPLFSPPASVPEVEKGHAGVQAAAEAPGRGLYLRMVRARMRALYRQRVQVYGVDYPKACVRPDDARAYFETLNPPAEMSRNFLAAVFREPGWECIGRYRSGTAGSNGNELKAYRWVG